LGVLQHFKKQTQDTSNIVEQLVSILAPSNKQSKWITMNKAKICLLSW